MGMKWISILWILCGLLIGLVHCQVQQPQSPVPVPQFSSFYMPDRGNLYPYGPGTHDARLVDREAQTGRQIDLYTFFPYYGAKYNYSIISVHGYITFGNILDDGLDFMMGDEVKNWPEDPDPATIAVYACRQREINALPNDQKGVFYRMVFREEAAKHDEVLRRGLAGSRQKGYVDTHGDTLLDQLERDLKDGMVGAQNFRAAAALIVTWENVTFYQASSQDQMNKRATYQAIWMTDAGSHLSYVILNYHTLGYAGSDISGQMKRGKCKAQFNGGNQTGIVQVDPMHSKYPTNLASMSSVPHRVAGRYLFRVDDIVRRGGCSNMTSGTYRMTIYPDLVNAMGDVNVQVNGPCLAVRDEPVLQIAEFKPSQCKVKNAAIAECKMIRYYQWGTKRVYLQVGNNKAYVGSIYYVPPGLDPFQLDIGSADSWFDKQRPLMHRIKWHPGNFTDDRGQPVSSLKLALWGYKERKDEGSRKFIPILEKIGIISSSVPNQYQPGNHHMESVHEFPASIPQWVGDGERDIWTYRFGFLRLFVEDNLQPGGESGGLWSPPIPLHWWYGQDEKIVERVAVDQCMDFYNEDGHQWNFIMDTETNSSCPCRLEQAQLDIGRYMPHPKCSNRMRNLGCDAYVGAKECFLSAQNVQGHYVTHYGQVCCYDAQGYLMQTSYQSVVQVENYPYSPGFPQRAYEFGTYPYTKQFEIPTLSNYYHDVMPYFFCCKWVTDHCQFFYWRRPSSGCQNYLPPGVATVMGTGHFVSVDGLKYTFNTPGTYVLLHKPEVKMQYYNQYHTQPMSPEVLIETRLERFPNRMVDFSHRDMPQADLVQPTNVSVVTGVAIQEGSSKETDRIVITLRKDTRRSRYRLNVLVNDELRYFDTVQRQKYRGAMIYVNYWKEGQSEIYVALDRSRIGVRVRESYGAEIAKNLKFEESYGLLDVLVSMPPEYLITPDPGGQLNWDNAVAGLVGTYSHTIQDEFLDGNSRRPMGSSSGANEQIDRFALSWKVDNIKYPDLFTLTAQENEAWPEVALLKPVYPAAPKYAETVPNLYQPQTDVSIKQFYEHCKYARNDPYCPDQSTMEDISRMCMEMPECKYDYFETRQSVLAQHLKTEVNEYSNNRVIGTQKYNSCGAINIEYPEYLLIDPPTGKLYLEGDTVHFNCYQDHWVKGQNMFKCLQGGWTKGSQPWCRSKHLENTQKILSIVFGILLFIMLLVGVFACCFCVRRSRQRNGKIYRTGEPLHPRKDMMDPKDRKVIISTAETFPLVKSPPNPDWDKIENSEPKSTIVEFAHSTRSSPGSMDKSQFKTSATASPKLNGKLTYV